MREFKIPGKAQAKQRPRMGRSGVVYTPKETLIYENYVKMCYSDYANQFEWLPYESQVRAEIDVLVAVPKSDSKAKKQAKIEGTIRPTVKPDCDNLAKSILDSLNGLAYQDDKQVVELSIKKYYAENAEVRVRLTEV